MSLPIRITFRDMDPSDAIAQYVQERATKLDTFAARIIGCHVAVEMPHRHQRTGRHFRVRIDLTVPGAELVVGNTQSEDTTNEDAYAAVDEAFDRLGRRLEDWIRRQREDVKPHSTEYRRARVSKLWTYEGFGFLETPDGDEIYFHQNSVLDQAWNKLAIGSEVRFIEELGEKGPQASTVAMIA
jgi:ribosomal subunit interface protein